MLEKNEEAYSTLEAVHRQTLTTPYNFPAFPSLRSDQRTPIISPIQPAIISPRRESFYGKAAGGKKPSIGGIEVVRVFSYPVTEYSLDENSGFSDYSPASATTSIGYGGFTPTRDEPMKGSFPPPTVVQKPASKLKWWLLGAAIGFAVIAGAVVGTVLGLKAKHSSATTAAEATASAAADSANTPFRSIAAVSYLADLTNTTRVYYQDNTGAVMESTSTQDNTTWGAHQIGFTGAIGSPLAAAVSRPNFPLEITVYYADSNSVLHDIKYSGETASWSRGLLYFQGYKVNPNTSISAMYNQCALCSNTSLVVFQDQNNTVQVGNLTATGWTLAPLHIDPAEKTGLALAPFYIEGQPDQVELWHQKQNGSLAKASWSQEQQSWNPTLELYPSISLPPSSPLAAASSYSTLASGSTPWLELLSLSSTGISVSSWSGATGAWLSPTVPSTMSNATTQGTSYGSLAVTSIGTAFAVVAQGGKDAVQTWSLQSDYASWDVPTGVGEVDLGGVWN